MNYSHSRVTLLFLFGPRWGLQEEFRKLSEEMQISLIQLRLKLLLPAWRRAIYIELLPFGIALFLIAIQIPIFSSLFIFAVLSLFAVEPIHFAIKLFWKEFDMERKEREKEEHKKALEERKRKYTSETLRKWRNKCK